MKSSSYPLIVGLGTPVVDYLYSPQPLAYSQCLNLVQTGLANSESTELFQKLVVQPETSRSAGGSTLNAIRIASSILGPQSCGFFGCVGDDDNGRTLKSTLEKQKLLSLLHTHPFKPTCRILVCLIKKERYFCCDIGSAIDYPQESLKQHQIVLKNAKILSMEGFLNGCHQRSALYLAQLASNNSIIFTLSLAAPEAIRINQEIYAQLLPYVDYLFGNQEEARELAQRMKCADFDSNIEDLLGSLASFKRMKTVIITRGPLPVVLAHFQEQNLKIQFYPVLQIKQSEIEDTNGAGDAFYGGFLAEIALQNSCKLAIQRGLKCAQMMLKQKGFSI